MIERNCLTCNSNFSVYLYRKDAAKFCSYECSNGREISEETRKRMSKAKKGKYVGEQSSRWKGGKDIALQRRKEKTRKLRTCIVCKTQYKGGHEVSTKWCNNCRQVSLNCLSCGNGFSISRGTYNFRGGKFCSKECSVKETSFSVGVLGEKHWNWQGGINRVIAYRARKRKAEGLHTEAEWLALKIKYKFMCLCCKRTEPEIKLEEDHIIPLSRGGSNYIDNIQPLCRSCNAKKWAKVFDFRDGLVNKNG